MLVAKGIAIAGDSVQRVVVDGTVIDVIDTFDINAVDLPEDLADRLFVCAHRFAWETGEPVTFVGDSVRATLPVATVDTLVAMKAHALRFGSRDRRRRKRGSDLSDLLLLSISSQRQLLVSAPWDLATQVRESLSIDLQDHRAIAATLRLSGTPELRSLDSETVGQLIENLLAQLQPSPKQAGPPSVHGR